MKRPSRGRRVGPTMVLNSVLLVLLLGLVLRAPCTGGVWSDERALRPFCYTDVLPMYGQRGLAEGQVPYLEAANEYPVLTGMFMALAAWPVRSSVGFFRMTVVLLSACAVAITWLLYRTRGPRALYFAAAPSLLLYGFVNWDLLAVALATAGTVVFLRRRDVGAGLLLGLGAAAKVYPALLVVPFALHRLHAGERDRAARLVLAAFGAWVTVNLPFALVAYDHWSFFFRFNSSRATDWGTLWAAGCRLLTGERDCPQVGLVNMLSLIAFLGGSLLLWRLQASRRPDLPRWTLAFPLIVLFLLTNKVFSPQYSLWLLPWFALVLPHLRLFLAFEAADVAIFITHFSWQGRLADLGGLPLGALESAALVRAAVLAALVLAYLRHDYSVPRRSSLEATGSGALSE